MVAVMDTEAPIDCVDDPLSVLEAVEDAVPVQVPEKESVNATEGVADRVMDEV